MQEKRRKKKILRKFVPFLLETGPDGLTTIADEFPELTYDVALARPKNVLIEHVRTRLRELDVEIWEERMEHQLGTEGLKKANTRIRQKLRDVGVDPNEE